MMERENAAQTTAVRGVVLLVVVAAIGALIVNKGFHGDGGTAATGPDRTVVTTVPSTDSTVPGTDSTSSTVAVVNNGAIKVVVANGNTKAGAAGRLGEALTSAGFTVVKATNAVSKEKVATTVVYHLDGFQSEATRVAQQIATATVTPTVKLMPTPLPVTKADLGDAQVVVLLGTDLAT